MIRNQAKSKNELLKENEILRSQLEEAQAHIDAIRSGGVDALVVQTKEGDQVFLLRDAEHPYRVMVENMNEGAAVVLGDGSILYANPRLAAMLQEPLETLIGSSLLDYIVPEEGEIFEGLVERGFESSSRGEIHFQGRDHHPIPVLVSFSSSEVEGTHTLCMVAADLTEQKRNQEIIAAESLTRSIMDQAAEILIVCDRDGKIIRANQAAFQALPQNPLHKPFEAVFPLNWKNRSVDGRLFSLASVLKGESFQGIDVEFPSDKGQNRFFLLSATPLLQEEGQIGGSILTLTEITERKRMEEQLAYQAKMLDLVHDAIIITDEHLSVTSWNRAAEEMYGWKAEEAIGRKVGELIRSEFNDENRQEALRELDQKGVYVQEVVQYNRFGNRIINEGITIALRNAEGKITGYIGTNRDITARKQVEEAMRSYAAQLERSNQELQEFAIIASHDLQEPLRKIEAFGNSLGTHSDLSDIDKDYLGRMQGAARRMRKMIKDLLELSRVSTHGSNFEPVDLTKVTQTVLEDFEARLNNLGGQVQIDPLPVIEADAMQMQQLIQNLVGNAVKFHRQDVPPVIQLGYREIPLGKVEIFIQDNGIGFETEMVDQVFQPFRRLHGRSEYEGSGIGLAICRKIVERHHGWITAKSIPGEGSTFSVTLPVKQGKEAE